MGIFNNENNKFGDSKNLMENLKFGARSEFCYAKEFRDSIPQGPLGYPALLLVRFFVDCKIKSECYCFTICLMSLCFGSVKYFGRVGTKVNRDKVCVMRMGTRIGYSLAVAARLPPVPLGHYTSCAMNSSSTACPSIQCTHFQVGESRSG